MLTIGEFSTVTRLSIKALRLYHEEHLLVPEKIDPITGYRYYGEAAYSRAKVISLLRDLDFSLKEMREILDSCADDADLVVFFKDRLRQAELELSRRARIVNSINSLIESQRGNGLGETMDVTEMDIPALTILGLRYRGMYSECGEKFATLFKAAGRYVIGAPFCLYHTFDYDEGDCDIEACVALSKAVSVPGAECRLLGGGKGARVFHRGPYDGIGQAYMLLFEALRPRGLRAKAPAREIYVKGPGMIFPRSPKKFLTEIQVLTEPMG